MSQPLPRAAALYTPEAEEALIGSVLINPNVYEEVDFVEVAFFYLVRNRWIWSAITDLRLAGTAVDLLTVEVELEKRKQLDDCGGAARLRELVNVVPSSLNAESYARIVEEDYLRRRLMETATATAKLAYDEKLDPRQSASDMALALATISARSVQSVYGQSQAHQDYYTNEVARLSGDQPEDRVSTGYRSVDLRTGGGWLRGKLNTVHGYPGLGKTSFLSYGSYRQARAGLRVAVFALEDGREDWIATYRRAELRIDPNYRAEREAGTDVPALRETHIARITETAPEVIRLPMAYYDGGQRLNGAGIRQKLNAMIMREFDGEGLDAVYVDHLYYLDHTGSKNESYALGQVCIDLALIARDYKCAVILVAQDNKDAMLRPGPPDPNGLYMSQGIFHNSRFVVAVHPDEKHRLYEQSFSDWRERGITWMPVPYKLYIQKNNNGPVGTIPLWYTPAHRRFDEVAPEAEAQPPTTGVALV